METPEQPITAKVKVVKEEPCELTLSIELPLDEVNKETSLVYQDIQKRAVLPGFRAGKAPIELIQKNFAARARQTILENLIGRSANQILKERQLQTIDTPKIEKIEFAENKPLSFQMKVEKDPEIKVKDYKGIKVKRKALSVTEEMISNSIKDLQDRNATLVATSATAVDKNHFVVLDFEGKIDGKSFPGGTAKNYLMDMSAPQTIAGFSEGIVGAKPQESRPVTVKFPADYTRKEWAGKEALFQVTVKEIKEKKVPLLDDEFAKDLGLTSLAELQQKVKENLEKEETAKLDKDVEDQLFQSLLESNRFTVPVTLVEERIKTLIQRARANLERSGLIAPDDAGADAALREKARPQAEKDVRLSYLLKTIAAQESLENVDTEREDLKNKALAENKDNAEAVEKYFISNDLSIRSSLMESKVIEFLKAQAKIKTVTE